MKTLFGCVAILLLAGCGETSPDQQPIQSQPIPVEQEKAESAESQIDHGLPLNVSLEEVKREYRRKYEELNRKHRELGTYSELDIDLLLKFEKDKLADGSTLWWASFQGSMVEAQSDPANLTYLLTANLSPEKAENDMLGLSSLSALMPVIDLTLSGQERESVSDWFRKQMKRIKNENDIYATYRSSGLLFKFEYVTNSAGPEIASLSVTNPR